MNDDRRGKTNQSVAEIANDKKFLQLHQWRQSLFGGLEWTTGLLVSGMEYWNGLLPNEMALK